MLVKKKKAQLAANVAFSVVFLSNTKVLSVKSHSNEWKIKRMEKSKRQVSGSLFIHFSKNRDA